MINIIKIALEKYLSSPDLEIVVTRTEKMDEGWMLFYASKEYLESNNTSYLLAGPAAYLYDSHKGLYYPMGMAGETWQQSLLKYREKTYIFFPIGQLDIKQKKIIKT